MNGQVNLEKELFAEALEIFGEERERFLSAACQGQPELLQRVRRLLEAQGNAEVILPDRSFPWTNETVTEPPGTVIGRYKLLEQIGEGGFGVVYLAEQEEPIRRKVALKVIKAGMDTKQVIARFEAERQALALMDHPNIAKILDGGVTDRRAEDRGQRAEGRGQKSEDKCQKAEDRDQRSASPGTLRTLTPDIRPLPSDLCPLSSDSGRPYFVMELVRGIPITRFCEEHQLTLKERLELFIPVCEAIQHAHQKGVIHRDIKPGNVLVVSRSVAETQPSGRSTGGLAAPKLQAKAGRSSSPLSETLSKRPSVDKVSDKVSDKGPPGAGTPIRYDRSRSGLDAFHPIPKVIDFGVAKAIHQPLTEKSLFTNATQIIGTPAYMSPEQAELGNPDVDTRIDVYSLGILLYEVLTGSPPFPEEPLKKSSYAEIQRIIREEEPEKPSTRLARRTSTSSAAAAVEQSQIENRKSKILSLRGDVDWIVLKAIEKNRDCRYATPLELAAG